MFDWVQRFIICHSSIMFIIHSNFEEKKYKHELFRKVLYMLALCSPCNKYSCNYKCVKVMFESQFHYFSLMGNFIPLMTVLYLSLKIYLRQLKITVTLGFTYPHCQS